MLDIPGLPDLRATHLTTFTVKAGGVALGAEYGISQIEIVRQVNRIPRATLVLQDGDAARQDFAISAEDTLIPGVEVEISGGYSSTEALLFKGVVTRQRIELGPRFSRLVIEVKDMAFRMTLARMSRSFADQSDGDVLAGLIGGWPGLSADVTLPSPALPQIVQHQATDWDFLVMRAEANAALVNVLDGKVTVAAPAAAGLPVAQAIFGQGLRDAELELDAETQLTGVEVAAWDAAKQELAIATSDDEPQPGPGNLTGADLAATGGATAGLRHPGARDQAALDQWALAEMARGRRAAVRGSLTIQGSELVLPGVLINLAGVGARFNGAVLVTGVRHRLGHGDWTTEVVVGSDPRRHAERYPVAAPAAAGQLPPVHGLQIGVVVALEADPASEGRIQLRLPTISATEGTIWARQALTDAGKDRGSCFRPEIGDEVVVGFLDADPRDPVILGGLHSSAAPSPVEAKDDNHEKAIVTRSGMRIHWDDDKVVATIDTPKGNSVVLSEADGAITLTDEKGNSVKMSDAGIVLDSVKDITLTAKGDITLSGKNLTLKAKASLGMEGGSGAELKSGATTVVKGSMVNIN